MSERNEKGHFQKGNTIAKGHSNPLARRRQQFADEFLKTLKPADLRKIIKKLITLAQKGDLVAIKEILDRAMGRARPPEDEPGEAVKITIKLPPGYEDI